MADAPQSQAQEPRRTSAVRIIIIGAVLGLAALFAMLILRPGFFYACIHPEMAANETAAAATCKAYAEAQEIYHRTDRDKNGVLEYAQSLKGDRSLFESKAGLGDLNLIDKVFADAEGPPSGSFSLITGYCFKVLKAQGKNAKGGAMSYIPEGSKCMTLGHALVAYPAVWDSTGRKCFMISKDGAVWQANLGPKTPEIVEKMTEFDPDPKVWAPAD